MKQLLYVHSVARPIVASLHRALVNFIGRRLSIVAGRLIPGRRGRRIVTAVLFGVSLLVQVVLLLLVKELVELSIDLFELWAVLARKYVELA